LKLKEVLTPQFTLPDREFVLIAKDRNYAEYQSSTTGNKIVIGQIQAKPEGKTLYMVKHLAKTVMGNKYFITSKQFYWDFPTAINNATEVCNDRQIPEKELIKLFDIKVFRVGYVAGEWSDGIRTGERKGNILVYSTNPIEAEERAMDCVSHIERSFNATEITEPTDEEIY